MNPRMSWYCGLVEECVLAKNNIQWESIVEVLYLTWPLLAALFAGMLINFIRDKK